MAFLDADDKQRIRRRIEEIEQRTSGEIVTVVARRSDDYAWIPLMWAALLTLTLPMLVYLYSLKFPIGWNHAPALADLFMMQCLLFLFLAFVLRLPALSRFLVPASVRYHRANMMAHHQFLEQRVHHTPHRTGILLFVSVAEHHVAVIPDQSLCESTTQEQWQRVIDRFVTQLQHGDVAGGFIDALDECEALLDQALPASGGTREQPGFLDDHLIEL